MDTLADETILSVDTQEMTSLGRSFLWVTFAILALSTVYFAYSTHELKQGKRFHHILATASSSLSSLAYLMMASGTGFVTVATGQRVYFVRYVDWLVTSLLILLNIATLAPTSSDTLAILLSSDVLMFTAFVMGAVQEGVVKWVFWMFGVACFIPIEQFLVGTLNPGATALKTEKIFKATSVVVAMAFPFYPMFWIIISGAALLTADEECLCYAVLDLILKSVVGFIIVKHRDTLEEDASSVERQSQGEPVEEKAALIA